jgi:hypothetical protein
MKRSPRKRIISLAALALMAFAPYAAAKKKPASDNYAIVAGSVFNEGGYALPDADVTLTKGASGSPDNPKGKQKPMEAVSDARGEFVFRVPPGPTQYTVSVSAKGYRSSEKTVSVQDQERVEVTFQLDRDSR